MKLRCKHLIAASALLSLAVFTAPTSADEVEDFTTNQNVIFDFGAYSGNFALTAEGIDIDIPASGDAFGGLGVAASQVIDLSKVGEISVTARLDDATSTSLVVALRETGSEFFSYEFNASDFVLGEFTKVSISADAFFFNGETADGVLNGTLENTGFQTLFGSTGLQSFTVQSVTFIHAENIPEPGSAAILIGIGSMLVIRRRR